MMLLIRVQIIPCDGIRIYLEKVAVAMQLKAGWRRATAVLGFNYEAYNAAAYKFTIAQPPQIHNSPTH